MTKEKKWGDEFSEQVLASGGEREGRARNGVRMIERLSMNTKLNVRIVVVDLTMFAKTHQS
jgi:hypothetical protein